MRWMMAGGCGGANVRAADGRGTPCSRRRRYSSIRGDFCMAPMESAACRRCQNHRKIAKYRESVDPVVGSHSAFPLRKIKLAEDKVFESIE
jgi:hypothetical protein